MSKNSEATTAAYKKGFENGYHEARESKDEPVNADGRNTPEHIDWEARRVRESAAAMVMHSAIGAGPDYAEHADRLASWILDGVVRTEPVSEERTARFDLGFTAGLEHGRKHGRVDGARELQRVLAEGNIDISKLVDEMLYKDEEPF